MKQIKIFRWLNYYIFVGNVPDDIMKILNTITDLNLYDSLIKLSKNEYEKLESFYGERWYCLECAASTTAYARNYIKTTIKKAEQKGFKVCYSDTDSCFLLLGDQHLDQAKEFMNENFRVEIDESNETVGYKIRKAEKGKSPYMLVVGEKEANSIDVSVRSRGKKDIETISKKDFISFVHDAIEKKIN